MADVQVQGKYQGAAKTGQRLLIKEWFQAIEQARKDGKKVVYSFIPPAPLDIIRAFDAFHFALPEVQALQCAIKGVALPYLLKAEEVGYSTDVCSYVKTDVGLLNKDMQHPLGTIPKPDLVLCASVCNTYLKWAEVWQEYFDVPVVVIDVPTRPLTTESYWGSDTFKSDRDFVVGQLRELIDACEKISGKKMSLEKLAKDQEIWNRVADLWVQIIGFNKHVPAVMDAFVEGTFYMGAIQAARTLGPEHAVTFLENVKNELQERIDLGIFPVPKEKFRLYMYGAPCWSNAKQYMDLFKKWDVVFVAGNYMHFVVEPTFRFDIERPIESAAESMLFYNNPHAAVRPLFPIPQLMKAVEEYKLDGVVFQGMKSCRLFNTHTADCREAAQQHGVPALMLEGDLVDPRYFGEAGLKNRIDAFMEALEQRKFYRKAS